MVFFSAFIFQFPCSEYELLWLQFKVIWNIRNPPPPAKPVLPKRYWDFCPNMESLALLSNCGMSLRCLLPQLWSPLEFVKAEWTWYKAICFVFWWTQIGMGQSVLSFFKSSNYTKFMIQTSIPYSRQMYLVPQPVFRTREWIIIHVKDWQLVWLVLLDPVPALQVHFVGSLLQAGYTLTLSYIPCVCHSAHDHQPFAEHILIQ